MISTKPSKCYVRSNQSTPCQIFHCQLILQCMPQVMITLFLALERCRVVQSTCTTVSCFVLILAQPQDNQDYDTNAYFKIFCSAFLFHLNISLDHITKKQDAFPCRLPLRVRCAKILKYLEQKNIDSIVLVSQISVWEMPGRKRRTTRRSSKRKCKDNQWNTDTYRPDAVESSKNVYFFSDRFGQSQESHFGAQLGSDFSNIWPWKRR